MPVSHLLIAVHFDKGRGRALAGAGACFAVNLARLRFFLDYLKASSSPMILRRR